MFAWRARRCRTLPQPVCTVSLALFYWLVGFAQLRAGDMYVDDTAEGANDGTSWASAFVELQAALDTAEAGTVIRVAAGTYRPSAWPNGGSVEREKHFGLKNGVTILGGHPDGGGGAQDRDPAVHVATLSGDLDGNAKLDDGNAYHVFYHPQGTDLDETAVLDGVTITAGSAAGHSDHGSGGGMYNHGCSPTLRNCVFRGNADGAMVNTASHPTLEACSFEENVGGGMYNSASNPMLANCRFIRNSDTFAGGGALDNANSSPILQNCLFEANSAILAGGIYNQASHPVLTNCRFVGNSASFSLGGGMYNYVSDPVLTNCTFESNAGGGLYNSASDPTLTNCTFYGNTADEGAGLNNASSTPTVTNCIFWANQAPTDAQIHDNDSVPVITYSCVEGGYPGTGNTDADPLFTNPASGSLRLQAGSPCIDAGLSDDGVPAADIRGTPRGSSPDMGAYEYTAADNAPSIALSGNGLGISNNAGNPSDPNHTWFGFVRVVDDGQNRTFTIANLGGTALELTGAPHVTLQGEHVGAFTVTVQPEGLVPVGGSTSFTVEFDPTAVGQRTAQVVIDSNDPNAAAFQFTIGGTAFNTFIFVDDTASGANDGSSWADAYTDLQSALNAAHPGNEIRIAAGVHKPSREGGGSGDRFKCFQLMNEVTIKGGYPNGGGDEASRAPVANPTILSGDVDGNNTLDYGNVAHVFYHPMDLELDETAVLDGVIITGGYAWGGLGGGMAYAWSATLINCTFEGNAAEHGGAMSIGGDPTLVNCMFRNNRARYGGAIYSSGNPTLENCVFSQNSSYSHGGAVFSHNSTVPVLVHCTFDGNSAPYGGALSNDDSNPVLTNCILWNNPSTETQQIHGASTVTYSCVEGGYVGDGNISTDPQLLNPEAGDLRLRQGSPCTDAGTTGAEVPVTDIRGFTRDATPDMGAYEYVADATTFTIAVFGGGQPIGNGSVTATLADLTDFGRARVDGDTVVNSFVIANLGDANLILASASAVSAAGAHASEFTVSVQPESPVGPTEQTSFTIAFNPIAPGLRTAEVVITTNDSADSAFIFAIQGTAVANTHTYVDDTAAGANDGSSWADAFTDLQSALNLASFGNEIRVAAGAYTPSVEVGGTGVRFRSFQLVNGVAVKGGYPDGGGDETTRAPQLHTTLLTGDIDGNGVIDTGNAYHVFHHPEGTELDDTAVLDGVIIAAGHADGDWPHSIGAGMYNFANSPALTDCRFTGNVGGGMANESGSHPVLGRCTFSGNTADYAGGGLYNIQSSPTLTNCVFTANTAGIGGGMHNYSDADPGLVNCTFYGNSANTGGAIHNSYASPTLINCILWGNQASAAPQTYDHSGSSSITYSCVEGGHPGDSNINSDPQLTNPAYGGLLLHPDSPCIDAGTTGDGMPATDFRGLARDATPDMGAYEYGAAATAPGIAVWEGEAPIVIGQTLPAPPGLTKVDADSESRSFNIANTGDAGLVLTGVPLIGVTGAHATEFAVSAQPEGTIPVANRTTFVITFDPTAAGTRTAQVSISSNAPTATLFVFDIQGAAVANTYTYVDDTATGANDGSSWADAFTDLQSALDLASFGNEIRIAAGVYTPSSEVGGTGARFSSFQLVNGVTIKGAYPDGGGAKHERDPARHATILSGDIDGNGQLDDGNVYHVLHHPEGTDLDKTAVLDGVTVTGGSGHTFDSLAGGMKNEGSSPTLIDCTFTGNKGYFGGGVYNSESNPVMTRCSFIGNSANSGAGMYNISGSPVLVQCEFRGNDGAGMYSTWESFPTLEDCEFVANTGGGFRCGGGSPVLSNCVFKENAGGGMSSAFEGEPILSNCLFLGNTAASGGAFRCFSNSTPTLINCTLVGNSAESGGAILNSVSDLTLINCVLWGNQAPDGPEILDEGSTTVSYSCIAGGWPGTGNVSGDPLFANPVFGGLRLLATSPCIDAGVAGETIPLTDFRGLARDAAPDMGAYEYAGNAPTPEIAVFGGDRKITNGDTTPNPDDLTDFALTRLEASDAPHSFTIANLGTDTLVLTGAPSIQVGGTNASDFRASVYPASPIGLGGRATFAVTFEPKALGLRTAQVTVSSNDTGARPFVFAVQGTAVATTTTYVDDTATGADDGTSWADAYTDLQSALDAATFGNEIRIAAGIYRPSTDVGGVGRRFWSFQLVNGVTVKGGYPDGG
ncbi:MAG: choice-of-anchor D domain-containing protein, partial [Lentisphaerae bacterium]|nr:choice-of-anchor D domain-containing protein [Lentisphaerota bacterium]